MKAQLYYLTDEQELHAASFLFDRGVTTMEGVTHGNIKRLECPVQGDDYIVLHNMLRAGQLIRYSIYDEEWERQISG